MTPADSPNTRVLQMLSGKWIAAAVSTAATLGLPDILHEKGSCTLETLAADLNCNQEGLQRLLRMLAAIELVTEAHKGSFELTALGRELCADRLKDLAIYTCAKPFWDPWSLLPEAIQKGQSPFELTYSRPLFEHLAQHPQDADIYHRGIDSFSKQQAIALAEAFDFRDTDSVVDVGGGLGTLLKELTAKLSHIRGILFDRPEVIDQARSSLKSHPFKNRIELFPGDFFESVPQGHDVYILKHVIHNWADDKAKEILSNCAKAAKTGARILVVEGLLLAGNRQEMTRMLDLEMLALCGPGKERSKPEMRALLTASGLKLESSCDLAGMARLLVTTPVNLL